jgi:hypothetical protein
MHTFDFLTNSVWAEVCDQLINKLPKVFHATFPAIFQKNFVTSMQFIRDVENLCISSTHLDNFRAHSGTMEIFKKFSLSHSIYFQLRFQAIVQQLETGLVHGSWNKKRPLPVNIAQKTSILPAPKDPIFSKEEEEIVDSHFKEYFFQWTQVTMFCLETCWKKDIFISPLTHRFFKLSIQIVHRLVKFVDEGLAGVSAPKPGSSLASLTPTEWGFIYEDLQSVQKKVEYFF